MNSPRPVGAHDQTFALRRVIELRSGCGTPTEAWLLGLGGGIGFQSFTFEYPDTPPILYVGTRCAHQYAYDAGFLERAAAGVGFGVHIDERGSRKKAATSLDEALERGPVIAWVGLESLHGVEAPMGETPWVVVVRERQGDTYILEDVYSGRMVLSASALAQARKVLKKSKHRILSLTDPSPVDPTSAVRAAVARCVAEFDGEHAVGGARKSFGLAALARWARRADSSSKKGWRTRFAPGAHLLGGLRQAYGWIERATGGGAFRPMYARFLYDAASLTGDVRFVEAAGVIAENGACWTALCDRMMDPSVPLLAECRADLDASPWPEPLSTAQRWRARADELPSEWAEAFYPELAERLTRLHAQELHARDLLAALVR